MAEVPFEVRATWRGDEDIQKIQPLRLYRPETASEVRDIVRGAVSKGCRVKAVGTGQSYSDMTTTTDFLIDMRRMRGVHRVAAGRLRPMLDPSPYIDLDAGVTVRELNGRLETGGRALSTMASYGNMTFVGTAMSGSHGSGPRIGEVASQIRSIKLVKGNGNLVRIEPEDGITDPGFVEADLDEALIQNDDLFHAAAVGLGCCGVVTSVIIETQPLYNLEEVRTIEPWHAVRQRLVDGSLLGENHWVELWINPHERDGQHDCLVTLRNPTTKRPRGAAKRRPMLPVMAAKIPLLSTAAMWFLDHYPRQSAGLVRAALTQLKDESFIGPPGSTLLDVLAPSGFANEIFFDLKDGSYLDALEDYFSMAAEHVSLGQRYMNLLAVRFIAPSEALMAMNHGRASVSIELPTLTRWHGARDLFDQVQRRMFKFDGRPHWALEFDTLTDAQNRVRNMYPAYARFETARLELDPHGTFANSFTDRIGLTP